MELSSVEYIVWYTTSRRKYIGFNDIVISIYVYICVYIYVYIRSVVNIEHNG